MKSSNVGRKKKYSAEFLKDELYTYFQQNQFEKITETKLAKATKIPRHIWRDDREIKELIITLNSTAVLPSKTEREFILPSAYEIVGKYYSNKNKLIENIQMLLDLVSDMYSDAMKGGEFKELERGYQFQIEELKEVIFRKERLIDKLNKEIDNLYLDSENPIKRKEKGLKANLIELNSDNIKKISKKVSEIEEEFQGLFD